MEVAANGGYPFVPITVLHAIVDGYGLPSSSFHAPNSLSPNLPSRSIDVQSNAPAQHRSTQSAIGTDVPLALTNVCFGGKNGHDAGVTPFPLMTHSGLMSIVTTSVLALLCGLLLRPAAAATLTGKADVVDGDTIKVGGIPVRLYGIDPPEDRQTCERDGKTYRLAGIDAAEKGQAFGHVSPSSPLDALLWKARDCELRS